MSGGGGRQAATQRREDQRPEDFLMSSIEKSGRNWREVKAEIERQIDRIWISEPDEIRKIRWGVIDSGAGSGGQSFSVLVHLEAYLMLVDADVMYRFLKVSQYPD